MRDTGTIAAHPESEHRARRQPGSSQGGTDDAAPLGQDENRRLPVSEHERIEIIGEVPPSKHGSYQRRDDFEEVSYDAVIGDLEDRSIGVLVDRDDGPRALHAHEVLDRPRDPERDVELGGHGLAGAADLALHRKPSAVADRPRRRHFR